jgi:hypothetical protein
MEHISEMPTIRSSGFRDRRVTGVTRSGRQTSHNMTSRQSPGRRTRRSAVAQDYLRDGDFATAIVSGFVRLLLLTLAVAHLGHNLVHRTHDGLGSLFRNSVIAILNDNLFPIRGQASEFGL